MLEFKIMFVDRLLIYLNLSGAVIVTANMNDIASLEKALDGANAMFLTTHYWEDKTKEKEIVKVYFGSRYFSIHHENMSV